MQALVADCFDRTLGILAAHRATLDRGAKLLLERETLDEIALKAIRDELQPAPAKIAAAAAQ